MARLTTLLVSLSLVVAGCNPDVITVVGYVPDGSGTGSGGTLTLIDSITVDEPVHFNESWFPIGISAGEHPMLTYCSAAPMPKNVLLTEDNPTFVQLNEWDATLLTFPSADGGHLLFATDAQNASGITAHRIGTSDLPTATLLDGYPAGGRSQFGKNLLVLSYGLSENGLPILGKLSVAELGDDGAITNEKQIVDIENAAFFGNSGHIPFALNTHGEIALGAQKQTHAFDENGNVTSFCTAPTVFFRKADGTVIEHNLLGKGGCSDSVSVFGIERLASDEHFSVLWGTLGSQFVTEIDREGNLVEIGELPLRATAISAVGDTYLVATITVAPQASQVTQNGIELIALSRDLSTVTAMGQTAVYDGDISSFPMLDVDAKGEHAFLTYIRTTVVNFQTLEEKNTTETVSATLTVSEISLD